VVWSPAVPNPVAVQYAWTAGPIGNVAARNGLPMFPFRSDNFAAAKVTSD
jgi:sialate O-acetylesterase